MKTLIIADIHLKHEMAEQIIRYHNADQVIFTGDFFDDFGDTPESVRETAEWFVGSVNTPNRIHLFGNHDIHYAFANRSFRCSGYQQWKYFLISDIVDEKTWNKVKWYHFLDDTWLLTHSGLHYAFVPNDIKTHIHDRPTFVSKLREFLDSSIREGLQDNRSWMFNAGHARGGFQRVGGTIWCDFNLEFVPFRGINQIFGHTPQPYEPRWKYLSEENNDAVIYSSQEWNPSVEQLNNTSKSSNLCLDVWKHMHWALWDGTQLKVGNYQQLKDL